MLSLNEFCIALFLMERHREGHSLPKALPSGILFEKTPVKIVVILLVLRWVDIFLFANEDFSYPSGAKEEGLVKESDSTPTCMTSVKRRGSAGVVESLILLKSHDNMHAPFTQSFSGQLEKDILSSELQLTLLTRLALAVNKLPGDMEIIQDVKRICVVFENVEKLLTLGSDSGNQWSHQQGEIETHRILLSDKIQFYWEKKTLKIKRIVFGLLYLTGKKEYNRGCEIDGKEEKKQKVLLPLMLKLCRSISYVAVAAHADQTSRRKLALFQVPLFLGIGEEDTALTKATESGDTDLVYLVLFHIWQKRPTLELFGMIQARPITRDLFIRDSRYHILAWLEALEETRLKKK
ncbi:unnamed protein product [Lactuca saligna]|uniref:Vps16 C-terminal domain-containing protein n=1 Tax=Lactuca saligna TaxID=75948 RepID=A0AA35Y5Z3_LACSI|nr:unnamed protein product [Lactuca saligna]